MKLALVHVSEKYADDAPAPDMEIESVMELRDLLGI